VLVGVFDTKEGVVGYKGFSRERNALLRAVQETIKENRLCRKTYKEQRSNSLKTENSIVYCAEESLWRLMVIRRRHRLNS